MRTCTLDGKKLPLKGDAKESCATCRFFVKEETDLEGVCHRYPPSRDGGTWYFPQNWHHPAVAQSDWCGEYEEAAK